MQKAIIHPTDFSDCANNALEFALMIAKKMDFKIVIVHALDFSEVSVTSRNATSMLENSKKLEDEAKAKLQELGSKIQNEEIVVEASIHSGRIGNWLPEYAHEINAEFVVMGTTGASTMANKVMGSHTFDILKKTKTPVIAVPQKARIQDFKEFVYLQDYRTPDMEPLSSLAALAKPFSASIDIVHFAEGNDKEGAEKFDELQSRIQKEIDYKFVFHYNFTPDIHKGIQNMMEDMNPDLLVLVMRNQNFFQRLFKGSLTEDLVNYCNTPLLVYGG